MMAQLWKVFRKMGKRINTRKQWWPRESKIILKWLSSFCSLSKFSTWIGWTANPSVTTKSMLSSSSSISSHYVLTR